MHCPQSPQTALICIYAAFKSAAYHRNTISRKHARALWRKVHMNMYWTVDCVTFCRVCVCVFCGCCCHASFQTVRVSGRTKQATQQQQPVNTAVCGKSVHDFVPASTPLTAQISGSGFGNGVFTVYVLGLRIFSGSVGVVVCVFAASFQIESHTFVQEDQDRDNFQRRTAIRTSI